MYWGGGSSSLIWGSEGNLQKSVLPSTTWVLGIKLYLVSRLVGPKVNFLKIKTNTEWG